MNPKRFFLKFLVWNMRWMTRYFGFIARPFVAWYADQEVIACGLRSELGEVNIIYSPTVNRGDHFFYRKEKGKLIKTLAITTQDFSKTLMLQVTLPEAKLSQIYVVETQKKKPQRKLRSPKILVKEKTIYNSDLLEIKNLDNGRAFISWTKARKYDPMIYFLAIEDETGQPLCGIYTKETFWQYPLTKKASLSLAIGDHNPPLLQKGKHYKIKLVAVDFEGWVSVIAKKDFEY